MSWVRAGEQFGQALALGWGHVRDGLVVPADPGLAVVRFAEHVEQVVAGGPVA
jgi:hypothetical protein